MGVLTSNGRIEIVRADGGKRMAIASTHMMTAIRYKKGVARISRHFASSNGLYRTSCKDSIDDTWRALCLMIFHKCCVNATASEAHREALKAATDSSESEVTYR